MDVKSLQFGTRAMLLNAFVALLTSIILPALWGFHNPTAQQATRSYFQPLLPRIWGFSQVLVGACMISLLWISSTVGATIIIGLVGVSWACTCWIPFALVSTRISENLMETSFDATKTIEGPGPALMMSLHNVAIAAPQILAAIIASFIFYTTSGSNDHIAYVLAVGGGFGLIAAWMARNLDSTV